MNKDKSHIKLSYVAPFYFDQKDASFLSELLKTYESYPDDALDVIQFIIVDDASPIEYEIPKFNLNILWLRISDNIQWNNPGARNLGVVCSKSDKVLITDIDHEFPEETLRAIIRMKECGRNFFRIRRRNYDDLSLGAHPNTFVMSRARFLRFYGYDEEFCGNYGCDDTTFVRWQKYNGTKFGYLCNKYYCKVRDKDMPYHHSLVRDLKPNKALAAEKIKEMKTFGYGAGHSRQFLNFKWELAYEHTRDTRPPRKKDSLWQKLWYWRWLTGST